MKKILTILLLAFTLGANAQCDTTCNVNPETFTTLKVSELAGKKLYTNTGGEGAISVDSIKKYIEVASLPIDSIYLVGSDLKFLNNIGNTYTVTLPSGGVQDTQRLVIYADTCIVLTDNAGNGLDTICFASSSGGGGVEDADFYGEGSTSAPSAIDQTAYRTGRMSFGKDYGVAVGHYKFYQTPEINHTQIIGVYDSLDNNIGGWTEDGLRVGDITSTNGKLNVTMPTSTDESFHRGLYVEGTMSDAKDMAAISTAILNGGTGDFVGVQNTMRGTANNNDFIGCKSTYTGVGRRIYGHTAQTFAGTATSSSYGFYVAGWTMAGTRGYGMYSDMSNSNMPINIGGFFQARNGATDNIAISSLDGHIHLGEAFTFAQTGYMTIRNITNDAKILSLKPNASSTEVWSVDDNGDTHATSYQDGFFMPVTSTDALAPNNTVYRSSDQGNKLVYKDSGGVVNVLY